MQVPFDIPAHNARVYPDAIVVTDLATRQAWSATAFDLRIDQMARSLSVSVGDLDRPRVAVVSRNRPEILMLQHACIRVAAIFVPLNWRLAPAEITALLKDCSPSIVLADRCFEDKVAGYACDRLHVVDDWGTLFDTADADAAGSWQAEFDPDRISTILYSSGTTGRSKGVCLTLANGIAGALGLALGTRMQQDSALLLDMPMFHTAGLFGASWAMLLMGGHILVSDGFEPERTYDRLTDPDLRVTHYFSVPQMAMMMRALPQFDGRKLARLTAYITGGAPNPLAHHRAWLDEGVTMLNGWGMSEIGSGTASPIGDLASARSKSGSVGAPHLAIALRVVDAGGNELPQGQTGEIAIAGPSVTPGYWQRPELDQAAFADGWFRSGDLGFIDGAGHLILLDRMKDMFISGGENVYPAEIEAALADMAGLAAVAAIGVPDPRWGEVGCLFAVCGDHALPDEQAVTAHLAVRLARYKIPKHFRFVDSIPMSGPGKPHKARLREMFAGAALADAPGG